MKKLTENEVLSIVGRRYGRLTVISSLGKINGRYYYRCKCDCGNIVDIRKDYLERKINSCGCLQKETKSKNGRSNKRYNIYDLTGEYGIGYTSKGEKFYFDLEDYDKIKDYCWHVNQYCGYLEG